jgi:protein O-mannosyl-transferase
MSSRGPEKTSPRAKAAGSAPRDRTTLFHLSILSVAAFALYTGTLWNGWITDDHQEVLKDHLIRSFANIPTLFAHGVWFFIGTKGDRYYRPLKLLVYSVEYHLFGFRPAWWHLASILFYLATILAIYFLVRDLASRSLAFVTALFFAFHPIHVEAVAWIAAGNDLLCALMLLLSLWLYHRARVTGQQDSSGLRNQRRALLPAGLYALSALLFLAGLFFKETALAFPAVILAYDFFYRGESLPGMLRHWRRYLDYFAVLGFYLALRVHALGGFAPSANPWHVTPKDTLFSVPVFAARYVWKSFLPINLNYWYGLEPVRAFGWKPAAAAALVLFLVWLMFSLRRRQPILSFALAWFLFLLVPVLDLRKVSLLFTDRYLYVPSFGFCIFAAWAWLWLRNRLSRVGTAAGRVGRSLAYAALAAVLFFYSFVILRRLPVWHDDLRLWTRTVQQSPNSADALSQAGYAYLEYHRFEDALRYSNRAVLLDPTRDYAYNNLASSYLALGRYDDALGAARKAIQLRPDFAPYWNNLAIVYRAMAQWKNAIEACQRGLTFDPNNHALLTLLGLAQWHDGQRDQAVAAYRRAIQAEPDNLDAYIDLAGALAQQGQLDAAIDQLLDALRAGPHAPEAYLVHFELGVIYEGKQLWVAAARQYQQSLDLKPDFAPARARLRPLQPFLKNYQP